MRIEVAIPCYNEEQTVQKVIDDFRREVKDADIVVYDNNSSDSTAVIAERNGARVIKVKKQGKGFVLQKILEVTEADIVVIVDGDDTYEAADVGKLLKPVLSGHADMAIGTRLHTDQCEFRPAHYFGNRLLTKLLNSMFRTDYKDILSGYRVINRNFIRKIPVVSMGFEVETELMIQSVNQGVEIIEVPINFRNRPIGSESKLNTWKDGYRILITMIALLRDHRSLFMFTIMSILLFLLGSLSWIVGFIKEGLSPIFPVLRHAGVLIMVVAIGFFLVGLILNTINTRIKELVILNRRK